MLWGTKAKAKKALIAKEGDHLVLECQHPSPQITNNTFDTDCKHFSQANTWLKNHGKTEIKW
jgi:uracil-DNA glycosylase